MNNMKRLLLFTIMILMTLMLFGQTVYSWTPSVNPGWTSSNPTSNTLNWQPIAGFVSSSDFPAGNRYINNQITSYTSPIINTTCSNASTVNVTINIGYDLESRYDWAYFQYSTDGGTTWNNPVAMNIQNRTGSKFVGNEVNLSAFPPLTNWVSDTDIPNRKGWTNAVFNINVNYIIPTSTTTIFRFIFASDDTVNHYGPWWSESDYYFDIYSFSVICNVMLPIELLSFEGYNKNNNNVLTWSTASENSNDYFILERSEDGEKWKTVDSIDDAGNSTQILNYTTVDNDFRNIINYYRLSQTDYNGSREYFKIIAIDNRTLGKTILKIVNTLGQEVDISTSGVIFIIYTNGEIERKFNI